MLICGCADNASITHARLILLDSFLLFFDIFTVYAWIKFYKARKRFALSSLCPVILGCFFSRVLLIGLTFTLFCFIDGRFVVGLTFTLFCFINGRFVVGLCELLFCISNINSEMLLTLSEFYNFSHG